MILYTILYHSFIFILLPFRLILLLSADLLIPPPSPPPPTAPLYDDLEVKGTLFILGSLNLLTSLLARASTSCFLSARLLYISRLFIQYLLTISILGEAFCVVVVDAV